VASLSLEELLAVSLFGANLPEQQEKAKKPRARRAPKQKPETAHPVYIQPNLLSPIAIVPGEATRERTPSAAPSPQPTLFDLIDDDRVA
jgi:hypothetical protein